MKKFLVFVGKIVLLTVLYLVLFSIGGALLGPKIPRDAAMQSGALAILPWVTLVYVLVLTMIILRSNWGGWRLMLVTGLCYYGVQTFMSQIETAYFGPSLGIKPEWLPGLFLQPILISLVFVPVAVWMLGKARAGVDDPAAERRLALPAVEWAWKLAVIAVLYCILYFGFGYFVAWQNPHLIAMYDNGANQQVFSYAHLIPFQLMRGVLWALIVLPVIRMSKGSPWQIALMMGIFLALPMNMAHALPNPIMPDPSVRLSHFIETATSNFIFGALLTGLILWRPAARAVVAPAEAKR
jgi:hypothetical protein